jgi:hypothetical protein
LFFQLLNVQTPILHSGFPELAIGKLWCEAGAQLATANVVSTISSANEQNDPHGTDKNGRSTRPRLTQPPLQFLAGDTPALE